MDGRYYCGGNHTEVVDVMIPCLYHAIETGFTTNGIGKLSDCISCLVTEKRNGSFELKLTYPAEGIHAEYIEEGNIILARPAEKKRSQPFRIYKITTSISGELTVCARHISYQLNFITVSPVSAVGCVGALAALKNASSQECPFNFETDIVSEAQFSLSVPALLRGCLGGMEGSVLDIFGGEYEWDRYCVTLHKNRGADHGVKIIYGKNLIDFSMERNIENVITAVHPYWKNSETGEVIELPEKVVKITREIPPYEKVSVLDCTSYFENQPTEEQLRTRARQYLNTTSLTEPNLDIDINFTQLWQTPGYADVAEAERVNLCDTVHVCIHKLGIEVSSKVTETEYDVLLERYQSITLSNSTVSSRNASLTASLNSIRDAASTAGRAAARAEVDASDALLQNATQQFLNVLSVSLLGLHCTSGTDENGETVQYAYNAVNLASSTYAWKNGKSGLFFSYDGGKTWKYGWDERDKPVATVLDTPETLAKLDEWYVQDNEELWQELDDRYVQKEGLTDELDKRYVKSEGLTHELDKRYVKSEGLTTELDKRYVKSEGLTDELDKRYVKSEGLIDSLDERYVQKDDLPGDQIIIADTAPEEPEDHALWIDESMTPKRLKLWNGDAWEIIGYEPPAEPDPTEPTEPEIPEENEPTEPEPTDPDTPVNGDETTENTTNPPTTDENGGESIE